MSNDRPEEVRALTLAQNLGKEGSGTEGVLHLKASCQPGLSGGVKNRLSRRDRDRPLQPLELDLSRELKTPRNTGVLAWHGASRPQFFRNSRSESLPSNRCESFKDGACDVPEALEGATDRSADFVEESHLVPPTGALEHASLAA